MITSNDIKTDIENKYQLNVNPNSKIIWNKLYNYIVLMLIIFIVVFLIIFLLLIKKIN